MICLLQVSVLMIMYRVGQQLGNSVVLHMLRHPRSKAYSAAQVLLNKQRSGVAKLIYTSVFIPGLPFHGRPGIPGLPFHGRPGFPAVLIPGFPGIKTPSFPGKTGASKKQLFIK